MADVPPSRESSCTTSSECNCHAILHAKKELQYGGQRKD